MVVITVAESWQAASIAPPMDTVMVADARSARPASVAYKSSRPTTENVNSLVVHAVAVTR